MTRIARGTQPIDTPQEAWIWIERLAEQQERLAEHIARFPGLRALTVASFFDPKSNSTLLCLNFSGGLADRIALRSWAADAGLPIADSGAWADERRARLHADVTRFRCDGTESSGAARLRAFAVQLTRASVHAIRGEANSEPARASSEGGEIATWTTRTVSQLSTSDFHELTV